MAKSSIIEDFMSPAEDQAKKKSEMKRYGRRQLLKEQAGRELITKNVVGAEINETEAEEEEMGESDGKILSTGSDSDSEGVDNTYALKALVDNFTVGAADKDSVIEETSERSMMRQTTGDIDQSGLVESSDEDEEAKESKSLAAPEDDMYYIEAIRSSRIGKAGKLEFLIKWQGYEKKSDLTWEPETTLVESAPEILSEYFEKVGGRETIGAKRKRGRSSKTAAGDSSEKLPKVKRQKSESAPVIEKVKIVWNEGESPGVYSAKGGKSGGGEGDAEEIMPKAPAAKKGRGRPRKSKASETSLEDNGISKTIPGIAPAEVQPPFPAKPSKSKKKEAVSKAKQEEKMEKLRKLEELFAPQVAPDDTDDAHAGPTFSSSSNNVSKQGQGRPPKSKVFETSQEGKDAFKNAPGIAPAQVESFHLSQALMPNNDEPMSKIEQENKMDKVDGLKMQSDRQQFDRPGFIPINEPNERSVTHSSNDVAKEGLGHQPKALGQVAPSADPVLPGDDDARKGSGCPPVSSCQVSSQEKPTSLEETSTKKALGRPPKSKEPALAQADEDFAGGVARKGPGRPTKNSSSTLSSLVKSTLKDTPAKRGPSKTKGPHSTTKESEENDDDRESSALD